jgi:putative endonuclease
MDSHAILARFMQNRFPTVYILASKIRGTLYIGVTSDPIKRLYHHKEEMIGGFTERYDVKNLVFYEVHDTMDSAIAHEKLLKKWKRAWKIDLIEKTNPDWRDLYQEIVDSMPYFNG